MAEVTPASKGSKGKAVFVPDPRKSKRFFEHAQVVSDARNYDYAIECWINGLKHDPESMEAHEKVRDVARRRLVAGGKPAGIRDKMQHSGGKTAIEKMLNAEFLWAKDPLNPNLALQVMELAVKAELYEVSYWIGQFVLEANDAQAKPNKLLYIKTRQLYEKMKSWDMAAETQRRLVMLDPNNLALLQELKQFEAEATVDRGGYAEGGSFRKGVKDSDKQKALADQEAIAGSASQVDSNIVRTRQEYEGDPDNVDKLGKLVRALLTKQDEGSENEAIKYLRGMYEKNSMYRLKMQVGDIRMRQYNRKLKELKKASAETHDEAAKKKLAEQYHTLRQEQLQFELAEFEDRVKNYPTQMELKYHLGLRQFMAGDIDKSIANFQEAQSDPKNRTHAMRYLGECFMRKHWFDEAVDTFRRGIEQHPFQDDKLALELRYYLMMSLEAKAKRDKALPVAEEAAKVASQIAQADFNFRDIRHHIENLRKLVEQLRAA